MGLYSVDDLGAHVFNRVAAREELIVRGKDVQEMATHYRSILASAAAEKDFSTMLATERVFTVYVISIFFIEQVTHQFFQCE